MDGTNAFGDFRAARDVLLKHRLDHDAAVREFRWPRFSTFNWALDWFDRIARGNDREALRIVAPGADQVRSYQELARRSDEVASWLRARGVGPGEPVLVLLDNRAELWELLLALMKLRAVIVPTFTTIGRDELASRMHRASVRHVVAEAGIAAGWGSLPEPQVRVSVGGPVPGWSDFDDSDGPGAFEPDGPTAPDEPLFHYFTSGTTARPKLVVHSHTSYAVGHLASMYWNGLQPGDVHLNVAPPGWAKHPWSSLFAPWNAEASLVSLPGASSAHRILDALERTGATSFCASPSTWRALLRAGAADRTVRLREAVSVGEPLTREIVDQVREAWGVRVRNGYGQSEVTAIAGVAPGLDGDPTELGRPLPGYDLVLCEPGSERPGREGELCVDLTANPVGMMRGYLDGPTPGGAAAMYRTGDLARWDGSGGLLFLGRLKDVRHGADGSRISPPELEAVLLEHPAVSETAVLVLDEPGREPVLKAFVVPAECWNATSVTAEALFAHTRGRPTPGIDVVEFVDDLPRTESGKTHRDALRAYSRPALLEFRRSAE
ncbi:AMP-binding protein [Saccharopolyspora sp. NPDC047091]|uniref:AMP-binding protein n=1 Tax=Saccharopolyspora sp. NPDC047091 TaxID=3155924 RepID=UPI00340BEDF7